MKIKRQEKATDQDNVRKAIDLLVNTCELNREIEGNAWLSAFAYAIAQLLHDNGLTIKDYEQEMDRMKKYYVRLWDEDDN